MDNHLEEKSRTKIKNEATELQKLGEKLIGLSHDQLTAVDIPPEIKEAVSDLRSITSNLARRRQTQYIGALMRKIDPEPVRQALAYIEAGMSLKKKTDTEQTTWAEALVAGNDDPFEVIISRFPHTDRQKLHQLVRNARKLKETPNAKKSLKTLVAYIKQLNRI